GAFFALVLAATALGAIITPPLLSALGLPTVLLILGCTIPVAVTLAYPRVRAVDTAALARLVSLNPRVALLETLDLFAGASRPVLGPRAAAGAEEPQAAGWLLIREGGAPDVFLVLVRGGGGVSASGEAATERVRGTVAAPAYFGEIGLIEHMARTATV